MDCPHCWHLPDPVGLGIVLLFDMRKPAGSPLRSHWFRFLLPGISVPIAHEIAIRVDFINQMGCGEAVH